METATKNKYEVAERLKKVVTHTPLQYNVQLSEEFGCEVYLKREDLQVVRSYKLRGAYNKISLLNENEKLRGVVCASAGNHAQGVAYSCHLLKIHGVIFMPVTTPSQKVEQVKLFGKSSVQIELIGDTFDDAFAAAKKYCEEKKAVFVHPFDDDDVIDGQSTVAHEILNDADFDIDYVVLPVGGGGLAAGVSRYFHQFSPQTKVMGVEPEGAASMKAALKVGQPVELMQIDKFVDGAAVKLVGKKTFGICQKYLSDVLTVHEGKVCTTILDLYNRQAIVVEPAGALSVAALEQMRDEIKGKKIVCIISGSNNDILRTQEIRERSLLFEGLKHYFIIRFPQRSGALKEFVGNVLGPQDDIVHFEYIKRHNRENGPALIGVEVKNRTDLNPLLKRLEELGFRYEYLNNNDNLLQFLL